MLWSRRARRNRRGPSSDSGERREAALSSVVESVEPAGAQVRLTHTEPEPGSAHADPWKRPLKSDEQTTLPTGTPLRGIVSSFTFFPRRFRSRPVSVAVHRWCRFHEADDVHVGPPVPGPISAPEHCT